MASRKRGSNWTAEKELYLAQLIEADSKILKGKFSSGVTHKVKEGTWEKIVKKINATFPMDSPLSRVQIYKKWMNMKSKAKDELVDRKKDYTQTGKNIHLIISWKFSIFCVYCLTIQYIYTQIKKIFGQLRILFTF